MKKEHYKHINVEDKESVLKQALLHAEEYGKLYNELTMFVSMYEDRIQIREEYFFKIFTPEEVMIKERGSESHPYKMVAYYKNSTFIAITQLSDPNEIYMTLREYDSEEYEYLVDDLDKLAELFPVHRELVSQPEFLSIDAGSIQIYHPFFETYPDVFDEYSFKKNFEFDDGDISWHAQLDGIQIAFVESPEDTCLDPFKFELTG